MKSWQEYLLGLNHYIYIYIYIYIDRERERERERFWDVRAPTVGTLAQYQQHGT
jgi:hypothetical protein